MTYLKENVLASIGYQLICRNLLQGCQWKVITKSGTTFCGKPVCVGDVQCPKGAMTEAQKGLRERSMFLYSVRNYLLRFRRISGVNILVQKKRISAVWHPCY